MVPYPGARVPIRVKTRASPGNDPNQALRGGSGNVVQHVCGNTRWSAKHANKWAKQLGLLYTPTIVFFDDKGMEFIRVNSVVRFYRSNNVLNFISSGGYKRYPNFQCWRRDYKKEK